MTHFAIALVAALIATQQGQGAAEAPQAEGTAEAVSREPLYTFTLPAANDAEGYYDIVMAAAALQGIINRDSPALYLSEGSGRTRDWLDIFTARGRWLAVREQRPVADLDALVRLAGKRLTGAVIWDPDVPATVNVATTIAGVRDAVVLSPEMATKHLEDGRVRELHKGT